MNGPALLHNMSSMPQAKICCDPPPEVEPFQYVLMEPTVKFESACPGVLLALLDGVGWTGTRRRAEMELRRRLNEHAKTLPLPALVLLGHAGRRPTHVCSDLLTVITVWSKTSTKLYLRDKEPSIPEVRPNPPIVLQVPPGVTPIGERIKT